ncbi:MAG: hypothetical protein ACLT33_10525 [Lachnospira pectinoschiza]
MEDDSVNNSNMPENDTIRTMRTRYIKSVINVQNVDVFEANDSRYDVCFNGNLNGKPSGYYVVSSQDEVEQLVEAGLIEDPESYNNCISDRIRKMYESYGDSLKDMLHMMER